MDIEILTEQLKSFQDFLNNSYGTNNKITENTRNQYYEHLGKYSNVVISRAMTYLYDNWHFRNLPLIADINDAIKNTIKQPDYKPLPKTEEKYCND